MKIRVILIDEEGANVLDIDNTCEAFNEALGWDDAWNTPTIELSGHKFIVVCSDLGKVRHEKVSCLSLVNFLAPKETLQEPFIVGNVIITKFDGIDDFTSLNEKDIDLIFDSLYYSNKNNSELMPQVLILD